MMPWTAIAVPAPDERCGKGWPRPDLKRMTGSYTPNSFSFYGTLANNATGELDNKRFIFLDAHDRMGFFTAKRGAGDDLALDVRITP